MCNQPANGVDSPLESGAIDVFRRRFAACPKASAAGHAESQEPGKRQEGPSACFPSPSLNTQRSARRNVERPREGFPGAAMRGAPGAGDVLQSTDRTVLYEPRGAISTGKSVTRFTSEGVFIQEGLPRGSPTPFGKSIRETGAPALRPEVQSLVRSPAMEMPEWRAQEHSYEMQKARDIPRNLNATDEERAVAESRLKEND